MTVNLSLNAWNSLGLPLNDGGLIKYGGGAADTALTFGTVSVVVATVFSAVANNLVDSSSCSC